MSDIEARLRRLEDLMEIHRLFTDYGALLDQGDVEGYSELFAPDGELQLGPVGRARGRQEIRDMMASSLSGVTGASIHIISSPQVTFDGPDTASSTVQWTVVNLNHAGEAELTMVGHHDDRLVRHDGQWRFARRRGFVDIPSAYPRSPQRRPVLTLERSAAMPIAQPGIFAQGTRSHHHIAEIAGFVYRDSRDLTGFIDGTENPAIEEAYEVATLGPAERGAGGSFALVQRWVHELDRFHALSGEDQEGVIGRTKVDSEELDEGITPPTAHISRVVIEENGAELEIYRRSVPYGTTGELGLQFVAFSADPRRYERMLNRMFGHTDDGLHDRLTEFSRPVASAYYFVPSLDELGSVLG